jgi:cation diffusion facilitator CzcD-associated flavoprotein CzcO
MKHVDVMIIGAGLSGIGAGYYLQTHCRNKTYAILEARPSLGGTWDLFRYPGVRSDSDMYTLGYTFRPWRDPKAIADGPAILTYIRETAAEYGIDRHIHFNHTLRSASWSSKHARWTLTVESERGLVHFTCTFLYMCTGYYTYDQGYTPEWNGVDRFQGAIIHPQQWPEQFDYTNKRIIIIGSGATAVTLAPALAERAAHVTMLQRSPTYIVAAPAEDVMTTKLRRWLPERAAYSVARWRAIGIGMLTYLMARSFPQTTRRMLIQAVRDQLGAGYDVARHFTPRYNPWDQRLCLVPDADLFQAIKDGKVSVETDQIETFTEGGIRLTSGNELAADMIVTATGLVMRLLNGIQLEIDGAPVDFAKTITYKGMMFSDIPNMALALGYTNASWTLKCELIAQYVCRLLNYMDRRGYTHCTPRRTDPTITEEPAVNFTSGYVQRALASLPSQGSKKPWKLYQNYVLDFFAMRFGGVNDGTMVFG